MKPNQEKLCNDVKNNFKIVTIFCLSENSSINTKEEKKSWVCQIYFKLCMCVWRGDDNLIWRGTKRKRRKAFFLFWDCSVPTAKNIVSVICCLGGGGFSSFFFFFKEKVLPFLSSTFVLLELVYCLWFYDVIKHEFPVYHLDLWFCLR